MTLKVGPGIVVGIPSATKITPGHVSKLKVAPGIKSDFPNATKSRARNSGWYSECD